MEERLYYGKIETSIYCDVFEGLLSEPITPRPITTATDVVFLVGRNRDEARSKFLSRLPEIKSHYQHAEKTMLRDFGEVFVKGFDVKIVPLEQKVSSQ